MPTQISRAGGVVIIKPEGRLDDKRAPRLEKHIDVLLGEESRFLIDLSSTEFIGGAGLRVLLMLARRLESGQGEFAICGMSPEVTESFDVAGLSSVFAIADTKALALRRLLRSSVTGGVADLAAALLSGDTQRPSRTEPDKVPPEILNLSLAAEKLLALQAGDSSGD